MKKMNLNSKDNDKLSYREAGTGDTPSRPPLSNGASTRRLFEAVAYVALLRDADRAGMCARVPQLRRA
jgi:hypothetical protein